MIKLDLLADGVFNVLRMAFQLLCQEMSQTMVAD